MYIDPRFCFNEIYYGPYIMLNNKFVARDDNAAYKILKHFGIEQVFCNTLGQTNQWYKFCEWFFYTYPIGIFLTENQVKE